MEEVDFQRLWQDAEEEIREINRRHAVELLEKDKANDQYRLNNVHLLQLIDDCVEHKIDLSALMMAANWIVFKRIV